MKESSSHLVRKAMDLPLLKKPLWFFLLLPFLFFLSFFVSFIASFRRNSFELKFKAKNHSIKVICVGNVIIGGTGKSPIVFTLAKEFIERGYQVAIASRGMSVKKSVVYFHAASYQMEQIITLSDENREHFEKLRSYSSQFFILQNKNRNESYEFFQNQILQQTKPLPAVMIMDDGLQNFTCPLDVQLCVWQPNILLFSPKFSMPVGPFREGFGKKTFHNLIEKFDYRLWSRVKQEDWACFHSQVENALKNYGILISPKDVFIQYEIEMKNILIEPNGFKLVDCPSSGKNEFSNASLISGIARPEAFLNDLKSQFPLCKDWNTLCLDDHAEFQDNKAKIKSFLEKSSVCFFSWKDFFRWVDEVEFLSMLCRKTIYGCGVHISFCDSLGNKINLSELCVHV